LLPNKFFQPQNTNDGWGFIAEPTEKKLQHSSESLLDLEEKAKTLGKGIDKKSGRAE